MTETRNFSLLDSPLEGTNLIEASAGTGKTYTITGLFLRLVLEKNLSVNEILVVTFTEAATEELKHRIRSKLREAIDAFSGHGSKDAFLNHLVRKNKASGAALSYLREALHAFDQAAIFTIHGFCSRVLHENAFECGSLFDTQLVTDQEDLKREAVDDFWRRHFYKASPLFVNYALGNKFSPDNLFALLGERTAQPYLKIIPHVEIPDTSGPEKEFEASFNEISRLWQQQRAEVVKILFTGEGLNKVKYREEKIPALIQGMDHYAASRGHDAVLFKGFEKFTSSELAASTRKGYDPPFHPFFELCERHRQRQEGLEGLFEQCLLALKERLFHYTENALTRRKREENVQSFDDLLLKVHSALVEEGGKDLARSLRAKFRAALIDEFQDTDPIQYAIFKNVFGAEDRNLFLIGDPKQAIYSFRGADIFAYMEAAGDVKSRYTLRENWRADPDLITAINAVFGNKKLPFVYDEIPFQPAAAPPGRKDRELLRLDGQSQPPFHLWFLDAEKITAPGKAISKTRARELIPKAVAAEISRLLGLGRNNRAFVGKRPLMEGDMAVLVRTNAEARLMQEALSALNIPSVLYRTGNLFDSHEALEMERVLAGAMDPNNDKRVKAALATDLIGFKGETLDALLGDENEWEKRLDTFRKYHDLWSERGFIRMFRYLLLQENVLPRLMSFPDGERRNTNLLHLSEVLHQTSIEKKLGMAELFKWLGEQRHGKPPGLEEYLLRLESDENAVKLVTIHKSKGLEYPIVFCPFAWDGSKIKKTKAPFTFHDKADNMRLTLDLGSEERDRNRVHAEKELLAENMRLLYVGLTRAKSRCTMVWGRFNESETSAPAYLFHQPQSGKQEDAVTAVEKRFKGLSTEEMLKDLETTLGEAKGTIRLSKMHREVTGQAASPLSDKGVTLFCREFSGNIDCQWRISSFSSLVSGLPHGEEMGDRDAIGMFHTHDQKDIEESVTHEKSLGIFSFPRGTKAGIFLHDLLEHLDFAKNDPPSIKELAAEKLRQYGFEPHWVDTICDTIRKLLTIPLHPELDDLRLSCISNKDRLNELEFYFPLKLFSPEKLKKVFEVNLGHQLLNDFPEAIGRLQFAPTRGFMKGFMDLVFQWQNRFYLVDWKSNFLGGCTEDYGQESLSLEMKKEFYVLQYIIYTLALDQYLRLRMPGYRYENHFGGVFYIFLRGVDPERGPDFGIYRDLLPPELIQALREELIEGARQERLKNRIISKRVGYDPEGSRIQGF